MVLFGRYVSDAARVVGSFCSEYFDHRPEGDGAKRSLLLDAVTDSNCSLFVLMEAEEPNGIGRVVRKQMNAALPPSVGDHESGAESPSSKLSLIFASIRTYSTYDMLGDFKIL